MELFDAKMSQVSFDCIFNSSLFSKAIRTKLIVFLSNKLAVTFQTPGEIWTGKSTRKFTGDYSHFRL